MCTFRLVALHPDYSPMLFRQLRHYQNVQYLLLVKEIRLYLCILCHTYRTPCGTGKSSACVMDIIWEELKRNNIDIDKDMLSFYMLWSNVSSIVPSSILSVLAVQRSFNISICISTQIFISIVNSSTNEKRDVWNWPDYFQIYTVVEDNKNILYRYHQH